MPVNDQEISGNAPLTAEIKETYKSMPSMPSMPLGVGSVLVPISLARRYTKEEIQAVIDLLQPSKKILILLTGILYRHTMPFSEPGVTYDDAYDKSLKLSEEWVSDNLKIFESSRTQVVIHNWHDWLLHHQYQVVRKKLEECYINNASLRDVFANEADKFMKRLESKSNIEDPEKARLACIDYLKEECTVCVVMKESTHFAHLVYAGSISKALAATFNMFKLEISIVRPEFIPTIAARPVQYQSNIAVRITGEDVRRNVLKLDKQAIYLRERSDILTNCNVFLLEKASPCVRNEAAAQIVSVMQFKNRLKLHKVSNLTSTLLIFSREDNGYEIKIDDEAFTKFRPSKLDLKYRPSGKLDLLEIFNPVTAIPANGIINLRGLEKEKSEKCKKLILRVTNKASINLIDKALLEEIREVLEFTYSHWVYSGNAPEAKFFIVGEEEQCGLYYSCPDDAIDGVEELDKITNVLSTLTGSGPTLQLFKTEIVDGTRSRSIVRITEPLSLANLFSPSFISPELQPMLFCVAPTPRASLGSTPPTSGYSTPCTLSRNSSCQSFAGMPMLQLGSGFSPRHTDYSGAFGSLANATYEVVMPSSTVNYSIEPYSTEPKPILESSGSVELDHKPKNTTRDASAGLFFTANRASVCTLLTTTIIGAVSLAAIAYYETNAHKCGLTPG